MMRFWERWQSDNCKKKLSASFTGSDPSAKKNLYVTWCPKVLKCVVLYAKFFSMYVCPKHAKDVYYLWKIQENLKNKKKNNMHHVNTK